MEIEKLSEYLEFVESLDASFCLSRGQFKKRPLLPGAYRKDESGNRLYSKRAIKYFIEQFKNRSIPYIKEEKDHFTEFEWLAYAQHYGIPTKLLDFTFSHITSLLFAVEKSFENGNEDDAVVWFLSPTALNLKHAKISKTITPSETILNEDDYDGPIAIQSRMINERISAQKGTFVHFLSYDEGLEAYADEQILKHVTIKSDYKKKVLSTLNTIGIGFTQIYPELPFLARDIVMSHDVSEYLKEGSDD